VGGQPPRQLGKGIAMIQFVTNMLMIGKDRLVLVAAPVKIKGGDPSPARVFAIVE